MNGAPLQTITVSGLASGIGKTLLSENIISLVGDIAAIKVTITDDTTAVVDDEQSIMVNGKDTFRFKSSGARKVVWIRSQEENLKMALSQALGMVRNYHKLLIEGNSILNYITPDIALFICDERLAASQSIKPSRVHALEKADIIFNNIRDCCSLHIQSVEAFCRKFNGKAPFYSINFTEKESIQKLLTRILSEKGLI